MKEKINNIVLSLIEKTSKKQANWFKVGKTDQFVLELEYGKVSINKLRTDKGSIVYQFAIVNDKGDSVYDCTSYKDPLFEVDIKYDVLDNLYNKIRHYYYKVDETIDEIIKEISKDENIGEVPF